MDLRVFCVFVAVAYVDVSARITCIFYPKSWRSAMTDCLNIKGTPIGISTVLSLTGLHLNGSFWTADYASITETAGSPVECVYRTKGTDNQLSQAKSGNCDEIKNYICGDHNMTSVRQQNLDRCGMLDVNGTFQFVSKCDTLRYSVCEVGNFTESDLSVCGSAITTNNLNTQPTFVSQKTETVNENTSTEYIVRNHASTSSDIKTGTTVQQTTETLTATMMSINENTTTVSKVNSHASSSSGTTVQQQKKTLKATMKSINENTTTESVHRSHASSLSVTAVQQTTEILAETMMSINKNTSTESIVRNHASSSSASALGIGLGASLSIVVIVILTMVSVCVYKRRDRNANCARSRQECGSTELGDIHVYDEISNNEESAYDASKVDIYDKIRSDGEKEHAYASLTSAPKY